MMENKRSVDPNVLCGQVMALDCLIGALVKQADLSRLGVDFESEIETMKTMLVPSPAPESLYRAFEEHCVVLRRRISPALESPPPPSCPESR